MFFETLRFGTFQIFHSVFFCLSFIREFSIANKLSMYYTQNRFPTIESYFIHSVITSHLKRFFLFIVENKLSEKENYLYFQNVNLESK